MDDPAPSPLTAGNSEMRRPALKGQSQYTPPDAVTLLKFCDNFVNAV